jgi:hypothetical protein
VIRWPFVALGILMTSFVLADVRFRDFTDPDTQKWVEESIQMPVYPEDKNLREFYVSEMTSHRFFVDESTLTVGQDGVVRYVLVVRTSGGATNVSFEGIHCERREFRNYASGRQDRTWAAVRKSEWRAIENKPINRQHAALSRDYFCPTGTPIQSVDEGRDALRRGKHPQAI